jgi:hypothetical protein
MIRAFIYEEMGDIHEAAILAKQLSALRRN